MHVLRSEKDGQEFELRIGVLRWEIALPLNISWWRDTYYSSDATGDIIDALRKNIKGDYEYIAFSIHIFCFYIVMEWHNDIKRKDST